MSTLKRSFALATVPAVLVLLVACGVDPGAGSAPAVSGTQTVDLTSLPDIQQDAALASNVPDDVKKAGIAIATSPTIPPMTYKASDAATLIGLDVDMSHAIGKVLGVNTELKDVGFDTIIPGLSGGRFTMALSSIGVTKERQKVVDFVSYYNGGQGFLASTSTDFKISKLEDLCGRRVAVIQGSVQQTALQDPKICSNAGLKPYDLQSYPDTNQGVLAIKSNRSDVLYGSISPVAYAAAQDKSFRVAGTYKRALVGAALPKGSAMTPLVQGAVQHLIDDGTYGKILDKWGLGDNGLKTAEINNATS